jgi:hypothetical protein
MDKRNIVIHIVAPVVSFTVIFLMSLFFISLKDTGGIKSNLDIVIKILFGSFILGLLYDILNKLFIDFGIIKHLKFVLLAIIISFLGGAYFYFLWVRNKLDVTNDIYLMIVVAGFLNGLIVFLVHYIFSSRYKIG